jgi:thioredoxin-related protein
MKHIFYIVTFVFVLTTINISFSLPIEYYSQTDSALKKAIELDKRVLIYFHSNNCGRCRIFEKTALKDSSIIQIINDNYIFCNINVDDNIGNEDENKYNITQFPTFIFIDKTSRSFDKLSGFEGIESFKIKLINTLDSNKTLKYFKEMYSRENVNSNFLYDYCYKLHHADEFDSTVFNQYLRKQKISDLSNTQNSQLLWDFSIYRNKFQISFNKDIYDFIIREWPNLSFKDTIQQKHRYVYLLSDMQNKAALQKNDEYVVKLAYLLDKFDKNAYFFERLPGKTTKVIEFEYVTFLSIAEYFLRNNDFDNYEFHANKIAQEKWNDHHYLNEIALSFISNIQDLTKLKYPTEWIKRSIELESTYFNNLTYALILLKSGDNDLSQKYFKKSLEIAKHEKMSTEQIEYINQTYNNEIKLINKKRP